MPRTYSLTYSARFGQGALSSQTATAFHARGTGGGPGGAAGARGPPGGAGRSRWSRWTGQAAAVFNRSSHRCRKRRRPIRSSSAPIRRRAARENAAKARQLSAELKAYVAQIEAARTAAGYPATMPAPSLHRCNGHLSRPRHDLRARDHA